MFLVDKINTDSLLEMQPVFILGMLYFIKSLIVKVLLMFCTSGFMLHLTQFRKYAITIKSIVQAYLFLSGPPVLQMQCWSLLS